MAESPFSTLLAPGRIGSLQLRNRILMCPMGDSLCHTDGTVSPNQAAYFEARSRGGAALLLVGSVAVAYPLASFDERQTAASDDRFLPGLVELTSGVHRHGGAIAAQLVHNGQLAMLDVANGRPMLVPDLPKPANPDRISRMVTADEQAAMMKPFTQPTSKVSYQVATEDDIAWVIQRFTESAERCVTGRIRRHRDSRRARLPDRRVPDAVDEPSPRRVGRRRRGPGPAALRGRPGHPRPARPRVPAVDPHQCRRAPQDPRRDLR